MARVLAQAELLKLAQTDPDLGQEEILPGRLRRMWPDRVQLRIRAGEQRAISLMASGIATLKATGAACDQPWVKAALGARQLEETGSTQAVQVNLGLVTKPGLY